MKNLMLSAITCLSILTYERSAAQVKYYDLVPDITVDASLNSAYINILTRKDSAMMYASETVKFEYSTQHASAHPAANVELLQDNNGALKPLSVGDVIDAGGAGNWAGVSDKYLGVRVKRNNQWYYGWIRMDVGSAPDFIRLKDYASNTLSGTGITAGQKPTAVSIMLPEEGAVWASGKMLFKTDNVNMNVTLYNLQGQLVKRCAFENNRLSLHEVPAGNYIVSGAAEGIPFRKVIVLFEE